MSATAIASRCPVCGGACSRLHRYRPAVLQQCADCGFAFQDDESLDELRGRYDERYFEAYGARGDGYESDDRGRRNQARVRLRFIEGHAPPPGRLLEFGAAAGHFLDEAERAGYESSGVEPEPQMAAQARRRSGVQVAAAFLENVDLTPCGYDLACGWHVLEHIPEPVKTLRHILRALRGGGHLFLEVPNFGGVQARRTGPAWRYLDLPHHVNQFGPRSLAQAARRAGFEVLAIETVAMAHYMRPSVAFRPLPLGRRVRLSVNGLPWRNRHPSEHDLLRLVARRPPRLSA